MLVIVVPYSLNYNMIFKSYFCVTFLTRGKISWNSLTFTSNEYADYALYKVEYKRKVKNVQLWFR